MGTHRALYLAIAGLCFIFYIAYGQWLSWIILLTVLGLPWFSLAISLPAIFQFRAAPAGPDILEMGSQGELWLMGSCSLPMPPFRGDLRLRRIITGETWLYQEPGDLPTDHCGGIAVTLEKLRVYDYLGLFSFPLRCKEQKTVLIRPCPVRMDLERDPHHFTIKSWQPKPGGGYAENHELRLYRPGDSLNQVHWKLSAKTGSLILREAMEPRREWILLTLDLLGTPQELDRKLGRLLWLGDHLLQQGFGFEIRTRTGEGVLPFSVAAEEDLQKAVDTLLCRSAAANAQLPVRAYDAAWHCHIGGEPDEA